MDVNPRITSHIDPEALARDCLEYVQVVSPTGEEGPGAEFFARLLADTGLEVQWVPVEPGRPNVQAVIRGTGGGPSLVLNGHVDTIPLGQCVPPRREGDWIWGRGTEDMKGGLVAMVHAARALLGAGVRLRGDLWLTGVVGHETPVGRKEGPRALIRQIRDREVNADAILIVEGPPKIWASSLGSCFFRLALTSSRGPIHTVKVPYRENPVRALGEVLAALDGLNDDLAGRPAHPLSGPEQLNIGIVEAGDYPNRLPGACRIEGTRRWTPGRTAAEVAAEFQQLLEPIASRYGLGCEVELVNPREPFATPLDHPLVRSLQAAGERLNGAAPEVIGMALVGDGNLYANEGGVPTVYYGPAHETAHSDQERVSISQLAHIAAIYALTAAEYCGVQE